ncbi:MAG: response regulator [Candidatus Sedimenticola sp. (ex Thyasira tokunagai)]
MNEKLLIVEDNEDSLVFLSRALSASGFQVVATANGVEALVAARENRPDLVISDIMMPKMDGFELCRRLKADDELSTIPLIFYTATYLEEANRELGLSIGAARYLTKPMELPQLLAAIKEVVRQHKAGELPVYVPSAAESKEVDAQYQQTIARKLDKKVAELERTHNYLRNVFDYMPSLLIGVNRNGSVEELNGEAESRLGITIEQALGKPVWLLFPALEAYSSRIKESLEKQQPLNLSRRKFTQEKTSGYIDIVVYPLRGDSAEGAVIRIDDISERVRMEESMIQSEKMLSIGMLAAGMAHEINNPLAGITLSLQNILRRIDPGLNKNVEAARKQGLELEAMNAYLKERKVIDMLEGIRDAAAHTGVIVDNMLHFSRNSTAEFELIDLAEILDQTLEMAALDYDLKSQYDFRNIRITKSYAPDLAPVPCIASEIKQVLLNLFSNAGQAMQETASKENIPTLLVSTYRRGDSAIIELADNGPGMDQEMQDKIFDPFYTTKTVGRGTGLGLFIAYFIVTDTHGGRITVESEPSHGAKFVIELPLDRQL